MLTSHSFYPKLTLPTRLSNSHGTLIDNFLCKLIEATLDTNTCGILINKLSDHQPYFTFLNNIQHNDHTHKYVKITKQDKQSIQRFHEEMCHSLECVTFNNDLTKDFKDNYNVLHNIIQHAKTKHMPEILVKYNKYKHKNNPWITLGIIRSIHYRDNLYKNYKMMDPKSQQFNIQKRNLKTYNNIL